MALPTLPNGAIRPFQLSYRWTPIASVVPFTYRDGWTMLQLIEEFRKYITDIFHGDLVRWVTGELDQIKANVESIGNQLASEQAAFIQQITDLVNEINNRVGPPDVKHFTVNGATSLPFSDLWPNNHVIWYEVKVESEGFVSLPENVAGSVRLPGVGGRTRFMLFPNSPGTYAVMNTDFLDANKSFFNVKDYGATGDGITDDTAAVQAAEDAAGVNGGVVFYPAGAYLQGPVTLRSNVSHMGPATIQSKGYNVFRGLSGSKKGYGASVTNVSFTNLTFRGDFNKFNVAASVTLHHADGVVFRDCRWEEAILGGHAIDLGACRNVKIENCVFAGFNPPAGREYAEAIQLDHSTASGMSNMDPAASYDGLPCDNISVIGCSFEPLVVDGVNYYAPNPIGSHATLTLNHRNIVFRDNKLRGHLPSRALTPAITAPIHFQGVQQVSIEGNEFVGGDQPTSVIKILSYRSGIGSGDLANPNAPTTTTLSDAVAGFDININGNTFSDYVNIENKGLVIINGSTDDTLRVNRVSVSGNLFENCYPTAYTEGNYGSNCVSLARVDRAVIDGNQCRSIRGLLYCNDGWGVNVTNNQFDNAGWVCIALDGSAVNKIVNCVVSGNTFTQVGNAVYVNNAVGGSVANNVISNAKGGAAFPGYANGNITIAASSAINVGGNVARMTTPVNFGGAIQFLRAVTASIAIGNLTRGWTKGVLVSADSSVTEANNPS